MTVQVVVLSHSLYFEWLVLGGGETGLEIVQTFINNYDTAAVHQHRTSIDNVCIYKLITNVYSHFQLSTIPLYINLNIVLG